MGRPRSATSMVCRVRRKRVQKAMSISRLASCAPRVAIDHVRDVGDGLGVPGEDEQAHGSRRERSFTECANPLNDCVERASELRDPVPLELVG